MQSQTRRSLFREQALEHYARQHEKDAVLRLSAPPVLLYSGLVTALLCCLVMVIWQIRVPTYIAASAVVLQVQSRHNATIKPPVALLFFAAHGVQPNVLHAGSSVSIRTASGQVIQTAALMQVEATPLSPGGVQQRYGLTKDDIRGLREPVFVVLVPLESSFAVHRYAGNMLSAQVQTGSQRLLSLLPGCDALKGV